MTKDKSSVGHGKPQSINSKLHKLLDCFCSKDRILVTIDADPDSMASAMALKRMLWRRVRAVTVAHFNEIRRFDNRTMVRLNKIVPQNFSKIVLVDGQPHHHASLAKFKYDAVIDHHREIMRHCGNSSSGSLKRPSQNKPSLQPLFALEIKHHTQKDDDQNNP